jgi:hypothetical protein
MDPWTISGRGPRWTGGTELAGAWPSVAPVCKDADQGAGEGEFSYPVLMPKPSTRRMHDPGSIVPHVRPKVLTDNQMS